MEGESAIDTGKASQDLRYFLSHLQTLSGQVKNIFSELDALAVILQNISLPNDFDEILNGLMELTIIKYQSFVAEFLKYKYLIADTDFQRDVKGLISDVKRMFPDLDDYRNQIAAHGYRRNGESLFSNFGVIRFKVPENYEEFRRLA